MFLMEAVMLAVMEGDYGYNFCVDSGFFLWLVFYHVLYAAIHRFQFFGVNQRILWVLPGLQGLSVESYRGLEGGLREEY